MESNSEKTDDLLSENLSAQSHLLELIQQTKAELKNALDIATFREFNAVCQEKSQMSYWWFWGGVSIILIVAGLSGFSLYISGAFSQNSFPNGIEYLYWLIFPKLLVTLPLVGLATFCINRYLKEQRLIEEYRFKSTCALHFNSYMELVQKLCTEEVDKEYREFLVSQINRLFTSPTDRIYKNSNPKASDLNQLADLVGVISPPLEKVVGLVKRFSGEDSHKEAT